MSEHFPYVIDSNISLITADGAVVEAKTIEPKTNTMACVQVVKLSGFSSPVILKLYDRRFATQLRENWRAQAWTPEIESLHRDLVASGRQIVYWEDWQADEDSRWQSSEDDKAEGPDEDEEEDTIESDESFLQFCCHNDYNTECRAYELMSDLQGVEVPEILGTVTVATSDASNKYLNIPGILMQYIKGYPLEDVHLHLHPQYWQATCQRAVQIIHHVRDRGVCNMDTKTRCFIVRDHNADEHRPEIFMVDFGHCVFKDRFKSQERFRQMQAWEDEEGAIGKVMEWKLMGGYRYCPSLTAMRLGFDFMRDEDEPNPPSWEEYQKLERGSYSGC